MIFLYNIEQCFPNFSSRSPHQAPNMLEGRTAAGHARGQATHSQGDRMGRACLGFWSEPMLNPVFFFNLIPHLAHGIYSWNGVEWLIESTKLGINKHRSEGTRRIRNFTNKESDLTNRYICIKPCSSFPHFPLWHTMAVEIRCWGDTHRITIE